MYSNVPLGATTIAAILIFFTMGRAKSSNRALKLSSKLERMDIPGTLLFLGTIYCLLLALQWSGQSIACKTPTIIRLFIGSGLLFVCFDILQWERGEYATIPLRVLRQRSILTGSFFLMFLGMSSFVVGSHFIIISSHIHAHSTNTNCI